MKLGCGLQPAARLSLGLVATMVMAGCGKPAQPTTAQSPASLTLQASASTVAASPVPGSNAPIVAATPNPQGPALPTSATPATLPPTGDAAGVATASGSASEVAGSLPDPGPGQAPPGAAPQVASSAAASPQFAQVIAVKRITQPVSHRRPHQACRDEAVAVRENYQDRHQVGGAVAGGVVGALAGRMLDRGHHGGFGALLGAAGGALAGHEIQKQHQEDNATRMETQRVCHTVEEHTTSSKTVAYDVTAVWNGQTSHVRMDHDPGIGTGLPVHDGVIAGAQVASVTQPGTGESVPAPYTPAMTRACRETRITHAKPHSMDDVVFDGLFGDSPAQQYWHAASKRLDEPDTEACLFYKSARLGLADSAADLGDMYIQGIGVPKSYAAARYWYVMAIHTSHTHASTSTPQPEASEHLGEMFANGQGVAPDPVMAYALFDTTANMHLSGCTTKSSGSYCGEVNVAAENRKIAGAQMTAAQIKEAQQLSQSMAKPGNWLNAYNGYMQEHHLS